MNVIEERHCSQHRDATAVGQDLFPWPPERGVSAKFIHDQTFHASAVCRVQQHECAQKRGENTAPVDIAHQDHWCLGLTSYRHIDQVVLGKIQFDRTACSLNNNQVVPFS